MMGTKLRTFAPHINLSLEELVPQDLFYRYLDQELDLSFVRTFVEDSYAQGGRPSIDPVVFFKFQLVMFFAGEGTSIAAKFLSSFFVLGRSSCPVFRSLFLW